MSAPAAVAHVRVVASRAREAAQARLATAAGQARPFESSATVVRTRARLTVNFHPDRRGRDGRTVAEGLLDDGRYRPQWETGLSNGGRFAVPGGARTRWESELFGQVYDGGSEIRPVYGALDLTADLHGGSPRFGSSFLVLAEHCFDRATFCFGDSHLGPTDVGTIDEFWPIMAGIIESGRLGDGLGRGFSTTELTRLLTEGPLRPTASRDLDHYIEAQIHGPLMLAEDVTAIVLDPSFVGTEVERHLQQAADRHRFDLRYHEGSVLRPDGVPEHFRGPTVADLAHRTVRSDGLVDAAAIGRALERFPFTEPRASGDPEHSHLQQYKKLWHCVLAFGRPANTAAQT